MTMTNVLLMAVTNIVCATNVINTTGTVTTASCRVVEFRLQQAEYYREHTAYIGASVDMTILAVRALHQEVESLRAEVERLKAAPQVTPQPYFAPPPQYMFPTNWLPMGMWQFTTNHNGSIYITQTNYPGLVETSK